MFPFLEGARQRVYNLLGWNTKKSASVPLIKGESLSFSSLADLVKTNELHYLIAFKGVHLRNNFRFTCKLGSPEFSFVRTKSTINSPKNAPGVFGLHLFAERNSGEGNLGLRIIARAASPKDDVTSARFSDPHPFRCRRATPAASRSRPMQFGEKRVQSFY